MSGLPKRTLEELAFYYLKVSNSDRDIFVEGAKDKLIIDNYLSDKDPGRQVYTMDMIDFSGMHFDALGLNAPSARSSVIALRKFLLDQGVDLAGRTFIVDRDIEDAKPTPYMNGVEITDSGALPVHLYDNRAEVRFCEVLLRGNVAPEVFKAGVNGVCFELYLVRAAASTLGRPVRILSPRDLISGGPVDGFSLDSLQYLNRCLHASGQIGIESEMLFEIGRLRKEISQRRLPKYSFINDHDLWEVIKRILDLSGDGSNKSTRDIEDIVLMMFDQGALASQRLFRVLEATVD